MQTEAASRGCWTGGNPWCQEAVESHRGQQDGGQSGKNYQTSRILEGREEHCRVMAQIVLRHVVAHSLSVW